MILPWFWPLFWSSKKSKPFEHPKSAVMTDMTVTLLLKDERVSEPVPVYWYREKMDTNEEFKACIQGKALENTPGVDGWITELYDRTIGMGECGYKSLGFGRLDDDRVFVTFSIEWEAMGYLRDVRTKAIMKEVN